MSWQWVILIIIVTMIICGTVVSVIGKMYDQNDVHTTDDES